MNYLTRLFPRKSQPITICRAYSDRKISKRDSSENNENLSEKIILQNFIMYGSKEVIVYSLYVYLVVKHMALTSLTSLTSPIVKIEELLFFHDFP